MHLTSTELLRVRDGRMYVIGVANPKPLRVLRAHVGSCLACTRALLDLHEAELNLRRRAERAPAADVVPALAQELALTDVRVRRAARARALGIGAAAGGVEGLSLRRRALLGLLVCVAFGVIVYAIQTFVLLPRAATAQADVAPGTTATPTSASALPPIMVSLPIADAPQSAAPKAAAAAQGR